MRFLRTLPVVFPVALTFALGCNSPSSESNPTIGANSAPLAQGSGTSASPSAHVPIAAPTAPSAPSASASAETPKPGYGRHGGGPAGMLFHAAEGLDLKPVQRTTIETLKQPLRDETGPSGDFKAFHAALIAGVRAGKIDLTKLAPLEAAIEKDMVAHREKEATALTALHAALDGTQRKALVAAVRAKEAAHEAQHKAHQAEMPKPGEGAKRRVDRLTKELDLDATQQKAVEALLAKDDSEKPGAMEAHHAEMKKQTDALLAAFEADTFDAKKLELGPPVGKKGGDPMTHHAQFLSQLVPLLKPDQRERLAVSMEKPHPDHGGNGEAGPACDEPGCDEGPRP